jgi:hypothetical protein
MSSRVPANKIERESFVKGQVSFLLVEDLPFNKSDREHFLYDRVASFIVEEPLQ